MSGEILFLCHRIPFPPDRGDKIRSFHILKALAKLAPVHVASFAETAADHSAEACLEAVANSHILVQRNLSNIKAGLSALAKQQPISLTAFADDRISDYVARILAERPIKTIFVFSGQMAQYIPAHWSGRLIMDFVDVDSAKFESYAAQSRFPMTLLYAREARLLRQFESKVALRANLSTFVSDAEVALFRDRLGEPSVRIATMGNGIDTEHYDPAKLCKMANPFTGFGSTARHLVFTGQMDYPPNVEAVISFAKEVLPDIRLRFPDAIFHIVGRHPTAQVRALAQLQGVEVTGEVVDIRPYIGFADAIVAPLRTARGIQNKVLEAMAMARPVIASTAAALGIDATDQEHFKIAANPSEEVQHLCDLLDDPTTATKMGEAARAHMIAQYGWDAQLAPLAGWLGFESDHAKPATTTNEQAA